MKIYATKILAMEECRQGYFSEDEWFSPKKYGIVETVRMEVTDNTVDNIEVVYSNRSLSFGETMQIMRKMHLATGDKISSQLDHGQGTLWYSKCLYHTEMM